MSRKCYTRIRCFAESLSLFISKHVGQALFGLARKIRLPPFSELHPCRQSRMLSHKKHPINTALPRSHSVLIVSVPFHAASCRYHPAPAFPARLAAGRRR